MQKALNLSYLFKGTTSPNPTVGALLVSKDGKYIDSAVSGSYGNFHAERKLLMNLHLSQTFESTLYVTLEPCCFEGKTPACTDIIIEKKVSNVVIATQDTHPKVNGEGVRKLREAGIKVITGVLEKKAYEINEDVLTAVKLGRPFIFAKYATSLDGFIKSNKNIQNERFSNHLMDRYVQIMRYRSDAILVGVNTVIEDNPLLTARLKTRNKKLLRIILDPEFKIPLNSRLLNDTEPTIVVVKKYHNNLNLVKRITRRINKEVLCINEKDMLPYLLRYLYHEKAVRSLMVEGGSYTLSRFLEKKLLDKVFIIQSNRLVGQGLSPFDFCTKDLPVKIAEESLRTKVVKNNILIFGSTIYEK